ncbi:uncharacterized protein LOC121523235 [Cheilinus undulatus]|uniref:uncharacterized protein LOC121523235 n=1 Tax=Cheilinus undulatus TaxID=241271 RepID=UPI001BD3FCC8|nr:uncharacterized protein LOC121523235 [Cheilinus undulatus]
MAEGVKEVFELLENFPKQDEIAEEEISNKEEGGVRVVIVRMSSDEKIEDVGNQSEEQPQLRGHNPVTETSQNLERNYEISQEAEVALPIVEEGIKDLKEVLGLHEELPKKEIGEQEMKQDYVEDKKEDISSRTEVQPHYKVSETLFLERKDAKILEEDVATKACPEVAGEVKEVIRLIEEVSKNEETAEKETSKINIGGEEEIRSRVEVQTWTSRALGHSNEKNQGENISTKASPEVAGEVIEVVKVIEEVSNNVETAEKETSKRDIGGKEEIRSRVEVQTWTSRTLGHSNEKNQEENISTKASPEVAGEVIEVVKVIEEVSNNGETAEKETSKGHVDDIRRIEVQTWTSRTLEKNNREKNQEEVTGTSAFPKVAEEVKEAIKGIEDISNNGEFAEKEKEDNCSQIGLNQPGLNTQISKFPQDDEVKCLHKDAATTAFPEVMKEVKEAAMLLEDSSKDVQIAEKEIRLKDEDRTSQREQEISSQSEVQQRVKSSGPLTSGLFEAKDAKTQVEEKATAALSQVKEGGQEERKEEGLATPVGQVKTLMVCDLAPPSCQPHELGEGSEANQTKELGTEDHPKEDQQLPGQEVQCLADKAISSPEYIHAASGNSSTVEERITPLFREAEKQVSLLAEANKTVKVSTETDRSPTSAVTGTSGVVEVVTNSAELQSDATQIEHNRAPQRKTEWADTVTEKTDRTRTVQEQVAVVLSDLIEDTQLPDTNAAETHLEKKEQPAEPKPDLNDGSLTVSRVPTVTSDILTSENPATEVVQDSDDTMNSAYSSLSTTLSFRTSSPPKEDELKYRFHKVSLISDSDGKESSQDAADSIKSSSTVIESNGADVESEYRWKNRFEGVSQYKPSTTDESSYSYSRSYTDSYSSPSSLSYTSTLPEATAYKHVSNALSSSSSFYTPSSEEQITFSSRLSDRSEVYLSRESEPAGERTDEWRRGLTDREEPAAPAGEREREGESESFKSRWESHQSPVSRSLSSEETSYDRTDSFKEEDDDSARFTGVFKATLVELVPEPTPPPPTTPPASPDIDSPNQFDMDNLVDTLKNMGPSMRPRGIGPRPPAPVLISSLPPIVEDAPSPVSTDVCDSGSLLKKMEAASKPAESLNGLYTLPADLGLKRNAARDTRPPLELMKQGQQEQLLNSPLRASATNSIVMRRSSDSSPEDLQSPLLNGNTGHSGTTSRLDSSVIFGSYRSGSIDQKQENRQAHRPLFRTSSLPETGLSNDRVASKDFSNLSTGSSGADQTGSRFERFSFLLNSTPSSSGSLTGAEDPNMRMSQPPSMGINSPTSSKSSSPSRILSPTGSIDLQRSFNMDPPLSMFGQNQGIGMGMGMGVGTSPLLQRSFSNEGTTGVQQTSLFSSGYGGSQFQSQEQEKNLVPKYRAFPDAYLTKEKEHGKLNPRPGKMYVFDRPGWCGQRVELRGDVMDATSWELQETISIRVVRGGWVLYEKPNFKGEKIALDEGDIELTYPFGPPEEQLQNGQQEGQKQNGEENGETSDVQTENKPARRFIIGSLRRAVRDYSVPEISLFPEENAEGKKVIFRDTSDDARIYGLPIKANSIIINAGLWLVYAHPFFQGVPRILEVGGYTNPAAWGVEKPYVGSLHPLKVGEPRVENLSEPKIVIYEKPYFTGKSRTITTNMRDFMTRVDRQQTAFMYSVASMKVLGGIWVGYEKEGFRGHQYLLEEGEYQDWRVWGGCDAELRSVRVIRADFTEPSMIMFEQPEEDQEGMQEENTFEVTEAIPDVELFEYKTSTRSIHVLSGAWVGYSHVDFSGNQYILEKGFYNNCADWGSQDNRICSVQPILLAPSDGNRDRNEVILYSEPGFQGECHVFHQNQETLPDRFFAKSCRVSGGSWVFYDDKKFSGNLYVLSEGDYPSLASMGCPSDSKLRSVKAVPMSFSIPSISLFGLECLEGREITMDTEIISLVEEGFNNHILSVRVNSGCWVICEHSNYRGRQFLLEPIEITYWPKFSSLQTIGSMYPVRQKHQLFRIKNKERDHFLSIQGGVEEMKSGRVVVTPEVEGLSDVWFYQDGLIKSKVSPTMSLQVVGNVEPAAKVSLWSETRQPIQTWTFKMTGLITSLTSPGMVLDVKGGKAYDKDHVVIMTESEERPSQQWEIELL